MDVIKEALESLRSTYEFWLRSIAATDAERELARIKIALIDQAMPS
jgi:hypothetical protein